MWSYWMKCTFSTSYSCQKKTLQTYVCMYHSTRALNQSQTLRIKLNLNPLFLVEKLEIGTKPMKSNDSSLNDIFFYLKGEKCKSALYVMRKYGSHFVYVCIFVLFLWTRAKCSLNWVEISYLLLKKQIKILNSYIVRKLSTNLLIHRT